MPLVDYLNKKRRPHQGTNLDARAAACQGLNVYLHKPILGICAPSKTTLSIKLWWTLDVLDIGTYEVFGIFGFKRCAVEFGENQF